MEEDPKLHSEICVRDARDWKQQVVEVISREVYVFIGGAGRAIPIQIFLTQWRGHNSCSSLEIVRSGCEFTLEPYSLEVSPDIVKL